MAKTPLHSAGDASAVMAPERPTCLAEVGLATDSIVALLLKCLYAGEASGIDLANRVRLPYALLEGIIEHARVERLVEVRSASGPGTAAYRYGLTDGGRNRARQCFDACGYVGPAPVPLDQYLSYMGRLSTTRTPVDRERVTTGLFPLVLSPQMVDQLGPAISSRRALFLYGPPGNGKSVIGSGIGRVLGGDLYVPHAIDVDGQIITLFDPVTHVLAKVEEESELIRSPVFIRPALGSHHSPGDLGRRRIDPRHARPQVQPRVELLRGPGAAQGQWRCPGPRRLRTPTGARAAIS